MAGTTVVWERHLVALVVYNSSFCHPINVLLFITTITTAPLRCPMEHVHSNTIIANFCRNYCEHERLETILVLTRSTCFAFFHIIYIDPSPCSRYLAVVSVSFGAQITLALTDQRK